jgi:hypothetical protein
MSGRRFPDRVTATGDVPPASWKKSPRVTPRAPASRSSELIDGEAWLSSTCDTKLAEKPVLVARVRTEMLRSVRSRRNRSPRFCSGLPAMAGFRLRPARCDCLIPFLPR